MKKTAFSALALFFGFIMIASLQSCTKTTTTEIGGGTVVATFDHITFQYICNISDTTLKYFDAVLYYRTPVGTVAHQSITSDKYSVTEMSTSSLPFNVAAQVKFTVKAGIDTTKIEKTITGFGYDVFYAKIGVVYSDNSVKYAEHTGDYYSFESIDRSQLKELADYLTSITYRSYNVTQDNSVIYVTPQTSTSINF